jgi:predicted DNA-binding transcriptional regulator YafY
MDRPDDRRRYTVAEIAETFHVSRKTIYRHLGSTISTPPTN